MPLNDVELMLATRQGDRDAFAELVRRHQRPLVNFFFRLLWDRQRAEDFAQEVFLKIFSHAGTYEAQAKFTTFLYRVAKNLWIDWLRVEGNHPRSQSLDAPVGDDEGGTTAASLVAGDEKPPEEVLMDREAIRDVQAAIEQLPEEQRLVLVLSEQQGMKYQEISEVLGIPVGTVKSRMHNAILRLREILGVTIR